MVVLLLSIEIALAKGEADIQAGHTVRYTPGLMKELSEKGKRAALKGDPVKADVR